MTIEKAKQILEETHNQVMCGVNDKKFDINKSLKDQDYDSMEIVEFIMLVEKDAMLDEIEGETASLFADDLNQFAAYIVKESHIMYSDL